MTITDRLSPEALARARRLLLLATVLMIGLVFVTPVSRVVAETIDPSRANVSGTVFDDRDGDGVRDQNEKGVKGVLVSDGVSIVQTDNTGGYELEVDPERRITDLVFITQPSGYTVPNDEFMTPKFWADLGQLAADDEKTADFALTRVPGSEDAEFSFANIADPHVNPQLPEQIREINATKDELDFIQVSGDLTNSATNAEFEAYLAATAESDLPVWPAVGNHEYQSSAGTTYAARIDNYRKYVGPEWYSFDYGNRHFVVIENNGQASQADQFEQQLQWFRRDLELNAQNKHVVVITHQPMNLTFGGNRAYDVYGDLLKQYGAELVLVGHAHSNDAEANSEFISTAKHVQTNSSSYTVDQTPRGFRYVHMKGDTFENPFRVYGMDHTLVLTNPVPGASIAAGGLDEIQVNAYHSSDEVDFVVYQLDGKGPWYRMTQSGEMSWYSAWRGPRPTVGQHSIEIQAHGPGGRLWSKEESFSVAGGKAVVPAATNDWPQHQGNEQHSGIATENLGRDLDLAWIYRTPGTFLTGSPVIVDGVVYAGTRDENAENVSAVHAVDLATGKKLWDFPTDSSVSRTVAVHDGVVYAQSLRANLYAIDAATGEQLWMRSPEAAPEPYVQRKWGGWGVTVSDGKVFWTHAERFGPGASGALEALDPKTGETIWLAPMVNNEMAGGTPVVQDGRVFVGNGGGNGGKILAYDVVTGARLWQSSNALGGTGGGVPSVGGGRVYVGEDNSVVARDVVTGADLWIHRSTGPSLQSNDAVTSTAAIAGDTVYMGFPDGRVTALNAASGAVVWSTMLPGDIDQGGVFGSPVVTGDTVYVGANNGHVYGFDRATGAQVWDYETGAWNATGMAVTGNTLVFGSWDGNLYAFAKGS
jgi:outer membrane protein assembly factor BamB/predicted phosphodiesterase